MAVDDGGYSAASSTSSGAAKVAMAVDDAGDSVVARVRNAVMLRAYQAQWWQG